MDLIETTREMVSGLLDIYLSSMSNRTNEIMKVLTLVATIFIPLTFIVGLYGMNFEYMPELKQQWGYPAILIVMLAVALGMLLYFRRKKWI
jgi:magnesium transporter